MVQLLLYTTSGCHLCEEAEKMLKDLAISRGCHWECVEISASDTLIDRYGVRIPVVANGEGRELDWPFTLESLSRWLAPSESTNRLA